MPPFSHACFQCSIYDYTSGLSSHREDSDAVSRCPGIRYHADGPTALVSVSVVFCTRPSARPARTLLHSTADRDSCFVRGSVGHASRGDRSDENGSVNASYGTTLMSGASAITGSEMASLSTASTADASSPSELATIVGPSESFSSLVSSSSVPLPRGCPCSRGQ